MGEVAVVLSGEVAGGFPEVAAGFPEVAADGYIIEQFVQLTR